MSATLLALAIAVVLAACSGSDGDDGEAAGDDAEVPGDDGSVSAQENPDNVLSVTDERGNLNARVIEVVRDGDDDGEVVFDLRVGDDSFGWTVYRSERMASLTPGT
jgi:hypothetical protein